MLWFRLIFIPGLHVDFIFICFWVYRYRAVNPPYHQILRIDREGMIDNVIPHDKWRHNYTKNARWFQLTYIVQTVHIQPHYCLNYSGIPEFMRKHSMLTVAQTTQNIWNFMVGKSSLQEIATLSIIREIYRTLIWRPGDMVQTLKSPGLSARVDSTVGIGNVW